MHGCQDARREIGFPARSSLSPGCSPTKTISAFFDPSPKTVCVPVFHRSHESLGLLPRDANAQQIDAALRAVAVGLIVRPSDATDIGFGSMPEGDIGALLTPRELEVLSAIADGDTNKTIARRLSISLHTVKFHVESVFRKLGARTRTEAVTKASERRRKNTITL